MAIFSKEAVQRLADLKTAVSNKVPQSILDAALGEINAKMPDGFSVVASEQNPSISGGVSLCYGRYATRIDRSTERLEQQAEWLKRAEVEGLDVLIEAYRNRLEATYGSLATGDKRRQGYIQVYEPDAFGAMPDRLFSANLQLRFSATPEQAAEKFAEVAKRHFHFISLIEANEEEGEVEPA